MPPRPLALDATSSQEPISYWKCNDLAFPLELVSKELNHLVGILHVYAGGLNFMKKKKLLFF